MALARSLDKRRWKIRNRSGATQDKYVEGREVREIVAHAGGAVGQPPMQLRPGPVEHRHEVVADDLDARGREVFKAGLVALDVCAPVAPLLLDVLRHRQALDNVPSQAGRMAVLHVADRLLPFGDFAGRPDFARGNMVQGAHDTLDAGLHHIVNGYMVGRPEPSPRLSHDAISFRTGAGADTSERPLTSTPDFS